MRSVACARVIRSTPRCRRCAAWATGRCGSFSRATEISRPCDPGALPQRGSSPSANSRGCGPRTLSCSKAQQRAKSRVKSKSASRALPAVARGLCNNLLLGAALLRQQSMIARTLYDKLWESHVVRTERDGTTLLYIDRHLVHEVTSPQAFEGLKLAHRKPWRVESIVATADHNTPTQHWERGIDDPTSRIQVDALDRNIREYGAKAYFPFRDARQGIVHVIGPESGATLPGMTVVCGDSHTSTHGAFGCLAFGIGTSEVEHVLATQCLLTRQSKAMRVNVEGVLPFGCTAKDVALAIIGKIGTAGGTGFAIEFGGSTVRALSMEGRMTVCNMAIEAGARAGMVAVDDVTIEYLRGRPYAPKGEMFGKAAAYWKTLVSDPGARFDKVVEIDSTT